MLLYTGEDGFIIITVFVYRYCSVLSIQFLFIMKKCRKVSATEPPLTIKGAYDPDWPRTSDLHPVKVALSLLSYGIFKNAYVIESLLIMLKQLYTIN